MHTVHAYQNQQATLDALLDQAIEQEKAMADAYDARSTANKSVLADLQNEVQLLQLTQREQFIAVQMQKLSIDATEESRQKVRELAGTLYDARDAGKDTFADLKAAIKGWGDQFTNTFVDGAMRGKIEFKDLADSIIRDLLRIQFQKRVTDVLVKTGTTFLDGFFHHTGGVAGMGSVSRPLPASTWTHAPRYHGGTPGAGLAANEVPAVLLRGERVLNLRETAAYNAGAATGQSSSNVVVNVIEAPGRGGQVAERNDRNTRIVDIFVDQVKSSMAADINQGSGSFPAALERVYGLNRGARAY
jgi:hypothetical protein